MKQTHLDTTLPQSLCNVNTQLPFFPGLPPASMIHHKVSRVTPYLLVDSKVLSRDNRYGVSSSRRILSPGLFMKRYHQVQQALLRAVKLTPKQAEVAERLLRIHVYHGHVYPKAETITPDYVNSPQMVMWRASEGLGAPPRRGDIGRATFWRTIGKLRDRGLLQVINRFLIRPHAQTSNLYILDKLLLVIARYLAEHGVAFYQRWLKPYLAMPGTLFWQHFVNVRLPLEGDFPGVGG